jgi:hypothetical protein
MVHVYSHLRAQHPTHTYIHNRFFFYYSSYSYLLLNCYHHLFFIAIITKYAAADELLH